MTSPNSFELWKKHEFYEAKLKKTGWIPATGLICMFGIPLLVGWAWQPAFLAFPIGLLISATWAVCNLPNQRKSQKFRQQALKQWGDDEEEYDGRM